MSERARQLHDSPWRGVFHLTGGGVRFLAELLGAAGASRTLLEARIPYARPALAELLGGAPRQACNAEVARCLAMTAFQRAAGLAQGPRTAQAAPSLDAAGAPSPGARADAGPAEQQAPRLFGFGGTASLATDRVKRGPCRAHLAVQTDTHTFCGALSLGGDRASQERTLAEAAWDVLRDALGLAPMSAGLAASAGSAEAESPAQDDAASVPSPAASGSRIALQGAQALPDWQALVTGRRRRIQTAPHDGGLLLPGAFNPLHDGHRRMLAHAEAKLGRAGAFELSIENPDKPMLDYLAIRDRLAQFQHPVWLTRLPSFLEKARSFPGATFVLGTDTLVRIADLRYYGSERERDRQLAELLDLGARFLAFGRVIQSAFRELDDCPLPQPLRDACTAVPEAEFRADISSTELRQAAAI